MSPGMLKQRTVEINSRKSRIKSEGGNINYIIFMKYIEERRKEMKKKWKSEEENEK